ncbi:hypothetical protein ANTRET_LOCUS6698 [Anthophora retusa]
MKSGSLSLVDSQLFSEVSRAVSVVVVGENGSNVYRGVSCTLKDVVIVDRQVEHRFLSSSSSSLLLLFLLFSPVCPRLVSPLRLLANFIVELKQERKKKKKNEQKREKSFDPGRSSSLRTYRSSRWCRK